MGSETTDMIKPNYVMIGSPRCGTTTFTELFPQHPDVFLSREKEPHFFSIDHFYHRGWDWYETLYEGSAGCKAIGEASTTYSQHAEFPKAVGRVIEHLPEAKIIYMVREPTAQIGSHWMLRLSHGRGRYPFTRDIRENPTYIDTASYWSQLQRYRDHYPDDRILVLFLEDLVADSRSVLQRFYSFLGVDPTFEPKDPDRQANSSASRRVDRWWWAKLKHTSGLWRIPDMMPRGVRRMCNQLGTRPGDFKPQWTPDARQWAIDQVAEDSAAILDYAGKPTDFWEQAREKKRRSPSTA